DGLGRGSGDLGRGSGGLEGVLQAELDGARRVAVGADGAVACRSGDVPSRCAPAYGVQDVEEFRAELNAMTLGDGEILANRGIQVEEARSAFRAHSCVAEFAQGRDAVGTASVVDASGAEAIGGD